VSFIKRTTKSKSLSISKSIRYRLENLHIFFVFHSFKILEFKELLKDTKILKSDIILDIGCGNGLETLLIGKKCDKIYGIDIFKENLIQAKIKSQIFRNKINSEFKSTTLENAGFKQETFDKIFSICVLEHISNYNDVLKESYRILKKKGQLIFSVDSLENIDDNKFTSYHQKKFSVKNYFSKEELNDHLKQIGFKKIKIYPIYRSNYAKKRFIKLTKNVSKLNHLFSLFEYLLIKKRESNYSYKNRGLYFIGKCYK